MKGLPHTLPAKRRMEMIQNGHGVILMWLETVPETVVDGLGEVWFDDLATLQRVTASDVLKEAQKHSVACGSDRLRLFVAEHCIR